MERNKVKPNEARGVMARLSTEDQSDVLGSYTGTPAKETDDLVPTQDQDDL